MKRLLSTCILPLVALVSCSKVKEDAETNTLGTVEITARLLEIPEGAVFHRDLYDYATILKYEGVTYWAVWTNKAK